MALSTFLNKNNLFAATTLRNSTRKEENNMGLHVAQDKDAVIENRESVAQYMQLPLHHFVFAHQTHTNHFQLVTKADSGKGAFSMENAIADTDALYTYETDVVLSSLTADCVPVLLYNEVTGLIAAIHSGWQGTVKEITPKILKQLIQNENNAPEDIHVILGPSLSQTKFEVDEDVYKQFQDLQYADHYSSFNTATGKYHIDNQAVVEKQCKLQGIKEENILKDPTCTFQSEEHFSYREDKKTGRHMSFIVRKSNDGENSM